MSENANPSGHELRKNLEQARAELASTLDALEYKLDVPARTGDWVQERKQSFARAWDEKPAVVAGIAVGALAVGTAMIGGLAALIRRNR